MTSYKNRTDFEVIARYTGSRGTVPSIGRYTRAGPSTPKYTRIDPGIPYDAK